MPRRHQSSHHSPQRHHHHHHRSDTLHDDRPARVPRQHARSPSMTPTTATTTTTTNTATTTTTDTATRGSITRRHRSRSVSPPQHHKQHNSDGSETGFKSKRRLDQISHVDADAEGSRVARRHTSSDDSRQCFGRD